MLCNCPEPITRMDATLAVLLFLKSPGGQLTWDTTLWTHTATRGCCRPCVQLCVTIKIPRRVDLPTSWKKGAPHQPRAESCSTITKPQVIANYTCPCSTRSVNLLLSQQYFPLHQKHNTKGLRQSNHRDNNIPTLRDRAFFPFLLHAKKQGSHCNGGTDKRPGCTKEGAPAGRPARRLAPVTLFSAHSAQGDGWHKTKFPH